MGNIIVLANFEKQNLNFGNISLPKSLELIIFTIYREPEQLSLTICDFKITSLLHI